MSRVLDAVRKLRAVTEQQLDAARNLRGAELAALNELRVDALFDLRIVLAEEGLPSPERMSAGTPLREEITHLDQAEQRLSSLARTVLDRLTPMDASTAPPLYARSGLVH